MVKYFKNIISFFILIPNLPFILILISYVFTQIWRNSNVIEIELALEKDEILNDDIKKWIKEQYPKVLSRTIAVLFYSYLIIKYYVY